MMRAVLLFCLFSLPLLAQIENPDNTPIPPIPDPGTGQLDALPRVIASGANYYSYIPINGAKTPLLIENLSQYNNDILLVGEERGGEYQTRILSVKSMGMNRISLSNMKDFQHIYLISMQPFHVQSEQPIEVMGLSRRQFPTVPPTRHIELIPVEDSFGKTLMVGTAPDGSAFYPVFGLKFGSYDAEEKMVEQENGTIFEVLER